MSISIVPIGVNGALSTLGLNTNYLIRNGAKTGLLDCGATANRALFNLGVYAKDIDTIYISHMHLDHCAGLHDIAIQRYLAQLPPPEVVCHAAIAGELWDRFLASHMSYTVLKNGEFKAGTPEMFFRFRSIETTAFDSGESYDFCGTSIQLAKMKHMGPMPVHGVVLAEKVFFTTDTIFLPDILERIANKFPIESCFHDCSFNEQLVHARYEELCTLPADIKELLIGVHYEDRIDPDDGEWEFPLARAGDVFSF